MNIQGDSPSPLCFSLFRADYEAVNVLLAAGATLETTFPHFSSLCYWTRNADSNASSPDVLGALIKHGASVNERSSYAKATAVHLAVERKLEPQMKAFAALIFRFPTQLESYHFI